MTAVFTSIKYDVTGGSARITLDRPHKKNALSPGLLRELHDALWEADADARVHAVAISGAGDGFSAGYDLGQRMPIGAGDADARYRDGRTIDDDSWILERLQALRM